MGLGGWLTAIWIIFVMATFLSGGSLIVLLSPVRVNRERWVGGATHLGMVILRYCVTSQPGR